MPQYKLKCNLASSVNQTPPGINQTPPGIYTDELTPSRSPLATTSKTPTACVRILFLSAQENGLV